MNPKDNYLPKDHSMPKSGVNQISQAPPGPTTDGINQITKSPKD